MNNQTINNQVNESLEPWMNAGIGISPISGNSDFHLHDKYEIYLLLNGSVNYFIDRSCFHLKRGDLLIFNNKEIHKSINLTKDPYERLVIHFDSQVIQDMCTMNTDLLKCYHNHAPGENNIIHLSEKQIKDFLSIGNQLINVLKTNRFGSDVLPLTYLTQLLVIINELFSEKAPTDYDAVSMKVQPVMQYIERNITKELTLEIISKELSLSKYYLCHIFKQEIGTSLFQYITMKRVALAKQLLAKGRGVTEACMESGFNDYSNFIRTFKKITDTTPGQYGKQFKI